MIVAMLDSASEDQIQQVIDRLVQFGFEEQSNEVMDLIAEKGLIIYNIWKLLDVSKKYSSDRLLRICHDFIDAHAIEVCPQLFH